MFLRGQRRVLGIEALPVQGLIGVELAVDQGKIDLALAHHRLGVLEQRCLVFKGAALLRQLLGLSGIVGLEQERPLQSPGDVMRLPVMLDLDNVGEFAAGLSVGADLEYTDEVTLGRALLGRREL